MSKVLILPIEKYGDPIGYMSFRAMDMADGSTANKAKDEPIKNKATIIELRFKEWYFFRTKASKTRERATIPVKLWIHVVIKATKKRVRVSPNFAFDRKALIRKYMVTKKKKKPKLFVVDVKLQPIRLGAFAVRQPATRLARLLPPNIFEILKARIGTNKLHKTARVNVWAQNTSISRILESDTTSPYWTAPLCTVYILPSKLCNSGKGTGEDSK
jgi:hypothetical protein